MEIQTNGSIHDEMIAKVNEYHKQHKCNPTQITLGSTQYRDLWLYTFYNYTRKITDLHLLTEFMDCKLVIKYKEEIVCS